MAIWDPQDVPADFREDAQRIIDVMIDASRAVERGSVDGLLQMFHDSPETFLYDYGPPRATGLAHLAETFSGITAVLEGEMTCEVVTCRPYPLSHDAAWTAAVMHVVAPTAGGTMDLTYRSTDIWRKIEGRWKSVHEHASFPVDASTGRADLQSAP